MGFKNRPTPLDGVVVVEPDCLIDDRGFFLESYHKRRFAEQGLTAEFVQDNHSHSRYAVLRGFHYQDMRAPMGKLVRCTAGRVLDVVVDLRVGAPTFAGWFATELSSDNLLEVMIPPGFGHAFLVLSEWADVQYKCTGYYTPASEGVVLWNDPVIGVNWPIRDPILSSRDRTGMKLDEYLKHPAFRYREGVAV